MRQRRSRALAAFVALLALQLSGPTPLFADNVQSALVQGERAPEASGPSGRIEVGIELVNLFVLRNDADFDRTEPIYGEVGPTEGFLGTFLKPTLHLRHGGWLHFYYETEIGTDLWSRSNPDHSLSHEGGTGLSIKQREVWGESRLGDFTLKAGFQRTRDVTGLFLNYWIGALALTLGSEWGSHVRLFLGEMPDQTFEGWDFGSEHLGSFGDDLVVSGLEGRWRFDDHLALDAGFYFMNDETVIRRTRRVGVGALQLNVDLDDWFAGVGLVGQFGRLENRAADGSDAGHFGWGAVAKGGVSLGRFVIKATLVALSADDESDGNDSLGFLWAGKRPAQGLLMNENPIRDIGGNLDEALGTFDGWFWEMRTGLFGGDLGLYFDATPWLNIGVVSQALMVLNLDNALGSRFVGNENEFVADFGLFDGAFHGVLTAGMLIPGGAGAAYVNLMDRAATDLLLFGQGALVLRF